jgi:hypothetical protein
VVRKLIEDSSLSGIVGIKKGYNLAIFITELARALERSTPMYSRIIQDHEGSAASLNVSSSELRWSMLHTSLFNGNLQRRDENTTLCRSSPINGDEPAGP